MSINWDQLGQSRFDRVEGLTQRRFPGQVRAVNGRGGDKGIDIRIESEMHLQILQLKYFREGFSGGFRDVRRKEIKESFLTAQQHQPNEWTLVVPSVVTDTEHKFVTGLSGNAPEPEITVIDRDELDSWLADDPDYDTYLQRDPTTTLAEYARTFQQETAALLDGADDLAARVARLGGVVDTVDPDWTMDFARRGSEVAVSVRPAHPNAAASSPIRVAVTLTDWTEETQQLAKQMEETFGFGSSQPIRIPSAVVDAIRIDGPAFIAGDRPPADVILQRAPSGSQGVGKPGEVRLYFADDQTPMSSLVGRVVYAERGSVGGTIEIDFCEGKLRARFLIPLAPPAEIESRGFSPGVQMSFTTADALPSAVRDVLRIAREIRTATKLELFLDGMPGATLAARAPIALEDYDQELLIVEQLADDLDVVQRKVGSFFNMPDEVATLERIEVRVARVLLDGGIVASPTGGRYTLVVTGADSSDMREFLEGPRQLVHRASAPHTISIGGRDLEIGPVYVIHPDAIPVNTDEALEALRSGGLQDFHLHIKPGDDRHFYLALADRPVEDLYDQPFLGWGLIGINQPDVEYEDDLEGNEPPGPSDAGPD